jgi:hypothetical protein
MSIGPAAMRGDTGRYRPSILRHGNKLTKMSTALHKTTLPMGKRNSGLNAILWRGQAL